MTTTSTANHSDATLADRAREAASDAQERVSAAASATVEAAKDHPYAAAGIAAGVAAAVGGAVYAATQLGGSDAASGKNGGAARKR